MFIFRSLVNVFAVVGVVLGLLIGYFGFFPLSTEPQDRITLGNTIGCTSKSFSYKADDINDNDIKEVKQAIGQNTPIEVVRDFAKSANALTTSFGSTTRINIDYCDVQESNDSLLNKFSSYLDSRKRYYEYGSFSDFVKKLNELPFATVTNVDVTIPTKFARSNYCNAPTQKMNIYLFSIVDSTINNVSISKKAVVFNVTLEDAESNKPEYKFVRNLVTTGQYLKARLYCYE